MDDIQRAVANLFGVGDEEPSEHALRRKNKKGTTAEESAGLGAESLSEGDYEAAIEHFRRSIEQRSQGDIAGHIDLGGAYEAAGRPAEALRQYHVAARVERGAPEPHLGASQIYKQYGKYKESMVELERAIALEPGNAFYRFKQAELFRLLRMVDEAVLAATEAAAVAPTDSFYHYWLADLLIDRRRFEEALGPMRTALELSPGDDHLYLRAAIAFWGAGKHQEAIRAIRLASELDPDKPLYHGVLAVFLRRTAMNAEAELEEKSAEKMDAYDREELSRLMDLLGMQ